MRVKIMPKKKVPTIEEKNWAVVCHLSILLGCLIPFSSVLIPFFIWIFHKPKSVFMDAIGKAVLNFQLSLFLYIAIFSVITMTIFYLTLEKEMIYTMIILQTPIFYMLIAGIISIIFALIGAHRAYHGTVYKFPVCIPFIR